MFSFKNLSAMARIAAVAGAILLALGVASVSTAHASTASPTAQITQSQQHAKVNNHCPVRGTHFTTYYDGCVHWVNYACVTFHHFNISPPDFVTDGCPQAVDLWTGSNETGHAICVPGGHWTGFLQTHRKSFEIQDGGIC